MNKTIGILAHVDAGKTTLAEQILYHTNAIRKRGRVDYKDAFLDSHQIEKDRGITIFSSQGRFNYKDSTYYLVDTPGHIDFSPEMERAISIMDYAIVVVSAVEGVQAHTETIWRLLRKYNIPTFIFINKIDRDGADCIETLDDIKCNLSPDAYLIENNMFEEDIDDGLIEIIAENNNNLLEQYLDGKYDKKLWLEELKNMINHRDVFPCFKGSALQDLGIEKFINSFHNLTTTEYNDDGDFQGKVYKVKYDGNGNRITYVKAIRGTIKTKDIVSYKFNGEVLNEKINDIRYYNGEKFEKTNEAKAGEVFGLVGLTKIFSGQGIGYREENIDYDMIPTLSSKVIYDEKLNPKEVLSFFKILEDEETSLKVIWHEKLKEIHIHVMGVIQLEILKEIVKDRFKLDIEFGPCQILYKETIRKTSIGRGHFEPLRHYAEVHLRLEPGQRGSGITFYSNCPIDTLAVNFQNLVKSHVFEREHNGILIGAPITDIKVTLINGKSHIKHTEGGDFREATYRALRQGLEKADSTLLEPYYRFKIQVNIDSMGRVLSDIQKFNGTFDTPKIFGEKVIIEGRGPVKTFMNYSLELVSFTKGRGIINFIFDGYDYCHNEGEIIKEKEYNKDADTEYTSASVFCSKGVGFVVKGNESDNYMHCISE
ncbi:TetM/TetW/TetO/TetS family tetracycline resistance ribosomal protection protein [Clostridium cadaveris]|uniref:GTP-binding protein n=1 Tax=Clostridium cadaveris TaxID=1529 RepID=UPI0025A489A7|nr:TetM/TetW/TetO/TetS family tetracycline resistance ribosomal protection protein [Clostridium cadaveris]MDM8311842.1 TetM/TetW/TetO/TetS family tetracycline resistance ribosomal protection protein [Clostridium cadaveris]